LYFFHIIFCCTVRLIIISLFLYNVIYYFAEICLHPSICAYGQTRTFEIGAGGWLYEKTGLLTYNNLYNAGRIIQPPSDYG